MADDDAMRDGEAVDEPVVQQIRLDQLQFKAMIAEITRIMQRVNQANVDLPYNDLAAGVAVGRVRMRARRGACVGGEVAQDESAEESDGGSHDEQPNWGNNRRQRAAGNFGSLKLRTPPFHGKNDPDAYLEWERKIELVFSCQHYTEERKVRLATTEFFGYAISW